MSILKRKSVIGLVTISVAGLIAACSQTVTPPEADDESSEVIEATDSEEASDEKADEKADEKSEEVSKDDSSKDDSSKDSSSKDDSSKDDDKSSSSSDEDSSEGSDDEASSSDEAPESSPDAKEPVKGEETSITEGSNGNSNVNVGTNDMDEVSNEEADKLDSLLKEEELPEGVEKIEGGINGGDIDVGNNDYYCYTGEGWLKINFDNLKESGLPFLWNGAAWGVRKKYDMIFDDACEAVYAVRK